MVDQDARRQDIARAFWTVVRRDGIDAVSVRSVATEAGTSPGALRHWFASQDELSAFSLQAVVDRVQGRLAAALPGLAPEQAAVALLEQLLPLDEERREETAVYLAFLGRPHGPGPLRTIREAAEAASRQAVVLAVELLARAGAIAPSRDLAAEADLLYPLVDGLAVHGTLWPERYPPAHCRAVLRAHLGRLRVP